MQTTENLKAVVGMRNPAAPDFCVKSPASFAALESNNFVSAAQCSLPGLFVF